MSDPPKPSPLRISISNSQDIEVDESRLARVAERAAEGLTGELSILLVGADEMAELNHRFLAAEGPTDVLAFPIDGRAPSSPNGPPAMIGEVVLCPQVIAGRGSQAEEMDLLVAHGVLHLLGYDHDSEEGAEEMRAREFDLTGRSGARAN